MQEQNLKFINYSSDLQNFQVLDGSFCTNSNTSQNEFTGYNIKYVYNKPQVITEINKNQILSTISLRPTNSIIIDHINYNGYFEQRYNNNKVLSKVHTLNGLYHGEYLKYSLDGSIIDRKFYFNGDDITYEINKYISSDIHEIVSTNSEEISETKMFNIMLRYGTYFKFIHESTRDSNEFDIILKYLNEVLTNTKIHKDMQ